MMPRIDPIVEARQMRERREAFELAQACNITLPEARRQLVEARWQARDAQRARCGTEIRAQAAASTALTPIDDSDEGLKWFQK